MLKKLLKYDLLKTISVLPYFYVATIVFAILTRVVNIWNDRQFMFILGQIFQGTTIALIVNCLINTIIAILVRSFRGSFYSDEGYLTHTLPVTKNKLLLSKLISALIVLTATILVIVVSLLIVFYSKDLFEIIKQSLNLVETSLKIDASLLILIIVFVVYFQFVSTMLMGFLAIVIGHSYNNGKISKSFLFFAIIYMVASALSLIILVLTMLATGNISEFFATTMKGETLVLILITGLAIYSVYGVILYLITNKLFNKGVNLD